MSRTYRRLDEKGYNWARFEPDHYDPIWEDSYLARRYGEYDRWLNHFHSDNYDPCAPCKGWRRSSHKIARARTRDQLRKVLHDPDHDFNVDLENEAHGLDLWDWY